MTFDTAFERSHPPNTITTPPQMDWQQVVLNGGPPCFFVEGPQFCGRAERWQGHGNRAFHDYVSLDDLLTTVRKEARVAAFKEMFKAVCPDCAEGDAPILDQQARWYYHGDGNRQVGCSASKLRIEAAANSKEGGGDG